MLEIPAGTIVGLFLLVLLVILVAMLAAVSLARRGRRRAHARIMAACFGLFVLALLAFEIRVRFGDTPPLAMVPMIVHVCFAVPALLLWIRQVATARRAHSDPAPHRRRGRILLLFLCATVATGAWVYAEMFV